MPSLSNKLQINDQRWLCFFSPRIRVSYAYRRDINLLSLVLRIYKGSQETNLTLIRSCSPSFPCILASIAASSSGDIVSWQQYMNISSSHPPTLGKQLPKGFSSYFFITNPVYYWISVAATPTKSPLSSIMPAGASRMVAWMGTRYCSTRSILLLTSMSTATAGPRRKMQLGSLYPSFYVTARMLTKPTFSFPNISTPSISIFETRVPSSSRSKLCTQSWNFLQAFTCARIP